MLTLLMLLFKCWVVESVMDFEVDRLIDDLKRNYSRYTRPPRNQSETLLVQVEFSLTGIKEFDEVKDEFSVIGTVVVAWTDDRVVWNPRDYGGLETIIVDNNVFWTPSIFLLNSNVEFEKIGEDPYWSVRYYYTGFAVFYPDSLLSAICSADVEKFPWDTQTCSLAFTLIGYLRNEVELQPYRSPDFVPLQNFVGDDLWTVENRSSNILNNNNIVMVSYIMKRKPILSVINIILPIIMMSFLNIMVFLIHPDTGERSSFCLTTVLALAVFLTLVSDNMPKSATTIPILSYYLVGVLAHSIVITIENIVSLKLYFTAKGKDVPDLLKAFSSRILCKRRPRGKFEINGDKSDPDKSTQYMKHKHQLPDIPEKVYKSRKFYDSKLDNFGKEFPLRMPRDRYHEEYSIDEDHPMRKAYARSPNQSRSGSSADLQEGRISRQTDEQSNKGSNIDKDVTWQTVSSAFDLLFFILSSVIFIILTLTYIAIAMN